MTSYTAENLKATFGDLMSDERLTEICVNSDGGIWIERAGDPAMQRYETAIEALDSRSLAQDLAGGTPVSENSPLAGSEFDIDGSLWRTQVVAPPIVQGGYTLSLRRTVSEAMEMDQLLDGVDMDAVFSGVDEQDAAVFQAYDGRDLKLFLQRAIAAKWNILFSGGTSSGKTTWLRACLNFVPKSERIVTIEDVYELRPEQPNKVSLRTCDKADSTALLRATLRLAPTRIMMGEMRGPEAYDFLSAINSGHPGGLSTLHATSPEAALSRLAFMVMEANRGMGYSEIIEYCRAMIDVIIQLKKVDGARRPTAIEIFRPRQLVDPPPDTPSSE